MTSCKELKTKEGYEALKAIFYPFSSVFWILYIIILSGNFFPFNLKVLFF